MNFKKKEQNMPESQTKTLLVTGAAGFSGHHMVYECAKAGYNVIATDISSRHYSAMFDALNVKFVASDLTKPDGLSAVRDPVDAIIHVAGIHDYSTPDSIIFAVNATAVDHVCRFAIQQKVDRFIHISSVGVYGYTCFKGRPVQEDDPKLTPPVNNYNASKWEGEQIVHRYINENALKSIIFRPAAIYGKRCEYGLYRVFEQVYQAKNKTRMLMIGQGDKTEAFVHIKDVCRACIHALNNDAMINETYNLSDDSRITTAEFFQMVCQAMFGQTKPFLHIPISILKSVTNISQLLTRYAGMKFRLEKGTLDYMSCHRIWDNQKIKDTGFVFKYPTIHDGLQETLNWYMDNGWFKI
jgi:nucleoside-diphosphate-sugar epimerase